MAGKRDAPRRIQGGPLGLDGATPEELERLRDANERVLAVRPHGTAEAGLPLPGPLRNPGFEVTPWAARPEIEGNIGKYCPKHLQVLSEDELDPGHYPKAARDEFGEVCKFCWACGRPVRDDGLSGMGHRGSGKPCPACGFRRKRKLTESQLAGLKKGQRLVASARAEGHTGRDLWRRVAETAPREGAAEERRVRRQGARAAALGTARSLTELMRMRSEERADALLKPYFEALDLEAREEWSPSTKLEFYSNQTSIAEKLLNRVEGLPVARHRHVDKDDEDVIPEGELSPRVVARLVAAIVAGADGDLLDLEGAVDAEYEEVGDA